MLLDNWFSCWLMIAIVVRVWEMNRCASQFVFVENCRLFIGKIINSAKFGIMKFCVIWESDENLAVVGTEIFLQKFPFQLFFVILVKLQRGWMFRRTLSVSNNRAIIFRRFSSPWSGLYSVSNIGIVFSYVLLKYLQMLKGNGEYGLRSFQRFRQIYLCAGLANTRSFRNFVDRHWNMN